MPRLPPSRSEDTLNSSHHHGGEGKLPGGASGMGAGSKKRPPTIYSSYSATSSPLLNVRSPFLVPMVPTTSPVNLVTKVTVPVEDIENSNKQQVAAGVVTTVAGGAVPFKLLAKKSRDQALKAINFIEREQQQEMEIFEETKPILTTTYLKPTLAALQNEAKSYQQPEVAEPRDGVTVPGQEAPPPTPSSVAITVEQTLPVTTTTTSEPEPSASEPTTEAAAATGGGTVSNATSILQVYAAYETGLPSGTSLKLRVTPKTSAREVIDLVVKQLNMAVVLKGREGPIYTPERLDNFCLVAVIGARERCLRDDFRPLQLQNPWRKGRLYVRQKHDLLAAIEHSNRDTADI
uniref:Ras-associating domain-containing protein n=1 Tax=Anopheles maculatus TaxID=74869 RepID=A0A182SFI7_9DIPT